MRLPAIARGITLNNYPIGWSPKSPSRFFLYIGIIKIPQKIQQEERKQKQGSVDKCWGHRNKNIKNSLLAMPVLRTCR